jgi:hypothetical protein
VTCGAAARCSFWRLGFPGSVVFDETHFGKFAAHYLRGSYVFDIHPPLGKMTFAGVGWLLGYDSTLCDYQDIGSVLNTPGCKYTILRGISATFGCAVRPPCVRAWVCSRELRCVAVNPRHSLSWLVASAAVTHPFHRVFDFDWAAAALSRGDPSTTFAAVARSSPPCCCVASAAVCGGEAWACGRCPVTCRPTPRPVG